MALSGPDEVFVNDLEARLALPRSKVTVGELVRLRGLIGESVPEFAGLANQNESLVGVGNLVKRMIARARA